MTTDEARTTLSARIATALLGRTAPQGASLALDAILTAPAEELAALGLVRIEGARRMCREWIVDYLVTGRPVSRPDGPQSLTLTGGGKP